MGLAGNKGGVSVRFSLYGSSYCFLCVHLAAGSEGVSKRNQNAIDILTRTNFGYIAKRELALPSEIQQVQNESPAAASSYYNYYGTQGAAPNPTSQASSFGPPSLPSIEDLSNNPYLPLKHKQVVFVTLLF